MSPLLARIPAQLCLALTLPPCVKRTPCRGKCSVWKVRLKASLEGFSSDSWTKVGAVPRLVIPRCSLDPVNAWLITVIGPDDVSQPRGPCFPCPCWRGVNLNTLRPLYRVHWTANAADPPVLVKVGLVNARWLAKRTFILKDSFTSQELDFLCVTETWLSVGESSAFSKLLPQDC